MTTHGPGPGVRSLVEAQRAAKRSLELDGKPGVMATADTVAKLTAAAAYLNLGAAESLQLNLGDGVKEYRAADVETLLCQCAESFQAYDLVKQG